MNKPGLVGLADLHRALTQVFITDGMLAESNMPGQVVLAESIPLNSSGKVDGKVLATGAVKGDRFSVKPVRLNGKVSDIVLIPSAEGENATMGAGIPEELEGDPYNILSELFGIIPELNEGHYSKLFQIPGLRELVEKLTGFDIKDIPKSLKKTSPKLYKLAYQKYLMPFMEGVKKMSKMDWHFPTLEDFGFPGFKMKDSDWTDDLFDNMFNFWDQMTKMEDSSIATLKKQWNQFFDYMMEMQDTATALLPENVPLLSVNPKEFAEKMKEFQQAQGELGSALGRLLAVQENYPELKANENFRDLQVQLEGTENRINEARNTFNGVVQNYNTYIRKFPKNIIAGIFGFNTMDKFQADADAQNAPKVKF